MEKPKGQITAEEYENLLSVRLVDSTPEQIPQNIWHTFAVTPNFTIYITDKYHEHLFEKYGVDLEATLTEGNLRIREDGTVQMTFKHPIYQQNLGFKGTSEELFALKDAIRNKVAAFLGKKVT